MVLSEQEVEKLLRLVDQQVIIKIALSFSWPHIFNNADQVTLLDTEGQILKSHMEELEKDSDKAQTGGQHIIEREIVSLKSGGSPSVKIPLKSGVRHIIENKIIPFSRTLRGKSWPPFSPS